MAWAHTAVDLIRGLILWVAPPPALILRARVAIQVLVAAMEDLRELVLVMAVSMQLTINGRGQIVSVLITVGLVDIRVPATTDQTAVKVSWEQ